MLLMLAALGRSDLISVSANNSQLGKSDRRDNLVTLPAIQFSSQIYSANENDGHVNVTIVRSGDTSGSSTVSYATSDNAGIQDCNVINGLASSRCDYEAALGTLQFAPGETQKTISILTVDDGYPEGNEVFSISLTDLGGATIGPLAAATVTILDNDSQSLPNPAANAGFFVRQHYLDFLNREPDPAGFAFWTNEITSCGADQQCLEVKRINVSAAFFLSIEFQQTGYLVERIYKTAYGDANGASTLGGPHQLAVPIVRLIDYLADTQAIGKGVVVNQPGWETVLENNKTAFVADFVRRARFTSALPRLLTPAQFVDLLNQHAGNVLSTSERSQLIALFGSATDTSDQNARAQVVRQIAENQALYNAEFNRAFVLMEYLGYLRRNPDDPQDHDYTGYDFWLTKLNQFQGNYVDAEMVKAFISSNEFNARFGPTLTGTDQPPSVNAGADQTIALPQDTASLNGIVTDDGLPAGGMLTVSWIKLSGPGTVTFGNAQSTATSARFSAEGTYHLRLSASDSQLAGSADVSVRVLPAGTPPDPALVAPPLDTTVVTTIDASGAFLYSGSNPIQTGVAPGTIKPLQAAVLRGRVVGRDNAPLPGVKISILNHPEFGQTSSRADGMFDMAVNGGGLLTINYQKNGYLTSQREVNTRWQDYAALPDVCLVPFDPNVTVIDLNSTSTIQVARGGRIMDSPAPRQATLFFKQGTAATMTLPNGQTQPLATLHVRATEYTVGSLGPKSMPGDLPPTSQYTYAADFSADEAVAALATSVTFSQPVVQYNENFLNFPAGTVIPSGAYDLTTGVWIPAANGLVIKILSSENGSCTVDLDGSGNPASDSALTAAGINDAERQQLAFLYPAGQSLWRVPLNHFSAWDSNWGISPPVNAKPPAVPQLKPNDPPIYCPTCNGSIIETNRQVLGEETDVVGTPFTLSYRSNRVKGRRAAYTLPIPLSDTTLPDSAQRIDLAVTIAGQTSRQSFPAQANQSTTFNWDGNDAYGRPVQGQQLATIDVGYVYRGVYEANPRFGYHGNGTVITGDPARGELTLHQIQQVTMGVTVDARALGLGGWTLGPNHFYDPIGHVLYEGDGTRRDVETVSNVIDTFGGTANPAFTGDGGPVTAAQFNDPLGIGAGPDGSIYVADTNNGRVRKVDSGGIVSTFAGNGFGCAPSAFPCGAGGPATQASLGQPTRVATAADGNVYLGSSSPVIWKVAPNGIISIFAGSAFSGFSGDGGPATQAQLSSFARPFPAPDGSVYISDVNNNRIRRVTPDGLITTVAGGAAHGFSGDGGPASQALIDKPGDLIPTVDGSLYFIDQDNLRIRRIAPDGTISTFAGNGQFSDAGDGLPATQASFIFRRAHEQTSGSMALGSDGAIYLVHYVHFGAGRIRRIGPDGIVNGIAGQVGNDTAGHTGDGGPAPAATMRLTALAIAPDGSLYSVGGDQNDDSRIRRVGPTLPGFTAGNISIPSESGNELYVFNANGKHLRTVNTLTGASVYTFAYDSAGLLLQVTDGDGDVTTVQRDSSGKPKAIVGPFGQQTALTLDGNGYVSKITDPAAQSFQFAYTTDGLLTSETDPRGNAKTFTYDSLGRLTKDADAAGGSQILARTDQGADFTVTDTTALNRVLRFQVQRPAAGALNFIDTAADNTQDRRTENPDGTQSGTYADGSSINITLGGDPRWKMQAPVSTSGSITTPGATTRAFTATRTTNLSSSNDPLSLTSQTDIISVNGLSYLSTFTAANKTFAMTTPAGRQGSVTIDAQGRQTQTQFGGLNALVFSYDSHGRLATASFGSDGEARAHTMAYNPAGFRSSITNPLGQTDGYVYDAAGRVTQRTLRDGRTIALSYDANGNLTSITPPGRTAHTFTFTAVDLPAAYTAPSVGGPSQTTFAYNTDRQLTTITRPDAQTVDFGYDPAGRLKSLTIPSGQYAYVYDSTTGQLANVTAPGAGVLSFTYDGFLLTKSTWAGTISGNVSHTFDNFLRASSQSINGANTVNYTYDNDSLLTGAGSLTLTRNAQNGLLSSSALGNIADTITYNGFGEATGYTAKFTTTTLYDAQITRDKLGRISQKVETIGGLTTTYGYSYDQTGRLTAVTLNNAAQPNDVYTYDSNDNRTSASFNGNAISGSYDAQDRLTQYGAIAFGYTANGERLSQTSLGQTTQYTYDALGNLRSVMLANGKQIDYLVDGRNRRVGRKENGALVQGFLYEGIKIVAELDANNQMVSRFVYGSREHVPDYMIKGGNTYRIISDQLGSPRLVVDVNTGNVAQRLDYDEFGVVLNDTNPGFQPFGFAGGLYDRDTGLVRFEARDYEASTGRWTAKDPILFAGGAANLYVYAGNDPVNAIDLSGTGPSAKAQPFDMSAFYREQFREYTVRRFEEQQAEERRRERERIRQFESFSDQIRERVNRYECARRIKEAAKRQADDKAWTAPGKDTIFNAEPTANSAKPKPAEDRFNPYDYGIPQPRDLDPAFGWLYRDD
ncbi:MAG TPA: RHS repeat-associated core domain-containing protein [Pyrinomonadaceae bacterium]|nr:RHS repeat-associated core domain-containing protein [Pyrinomonadaceae bacterium]